MSALSSTIKAPLELDYRAADGLEVWLLWTAESNRLFVLVHDEKLDEAFEFDIEAAEALDAFKHPYAYAAFRRVSYRAAAAQLAA